MAFRFACHVSQQRECSQAWPVGSAPYGSSLSQRFLPATAFEAATRRGADRIAVQPFGHAAFEGSCLGLRPRQPAIELGNSGSLVKVNLPVLGRPSVTTGPEQCDNFRLMPGKCVQDGRRRR